MVNYRFLCSILFTCVYHNYLLAVTFWISFPATMRCVDLKAYDIMQDKTITDFCKYRDHQRICVQLPVGAVLDLRFVKSVADRVDYGSLGCLQTDFRTIYVKPAMDHKNLRLIENIDTDQKSV